MMESKEIYGLDAGSSVDLAHALDDDNIVGAINMLKALSTIEISDFLATASREQRERIVEIIGNFIDPELLVHLSDDVRREIVDMLGIERVASIISKLQIEDIVVVLEGLDADMQEDVIALVSPEIRAVIHEVFSYPEDSAGRLIQKDTIIIPQCWTVGQTIDLLRTCKNMPEKLHQVFLVDDDMHPVAGVLLRGILCNSRSVKMLDIAESYMKIINTDMDREKVAHIFRKYSLLSAPVVNKYSCIVGSISIDDLIDVVEEETEEDIFRLFSGTSESDINASLFSTIVKRFSVVSYKLTNIYYCVNDCRYFSYYATQYNRFSGINADCWFFEWECGFAICYCCSACDCN